MKNANPVLTALHIALFTVITVLAYIKTLDAPFVLEDEVLAAAPEAWRNILRVLGSFFISQRWLVNVTFSMNMLASGLDTFSYHLINLIDAHNVFRKIQYEQFRIEGLIVFEVHNAPQILILVVFHLVLFDLLHEVCFRFNLVHLSPVG